MYTHTQQRAISSLIPSKMSLSFFFFLFKNLIENDEKQNLISDGLFNKLPNGWFLNLLANGGKAVF